MAADSLYYCGFNGFGQVPLVSSTTLTSLVPHSHSQAHKNILDVAVCWNYLVVVDSEGISKFGLVEGGKPAARRLPLPPEGRKVCQLSATPRHLLAVTEEGECWTHEEGKGWRHVSVGAELPATTPTGVTTSNVKPSQAPASELPSRRKSPVRFENADSKSLTLSLNRADDEETSSQSPLIDLKANDDEQPAAEQPAATTVVVSTSTTTTSVPTAASSNSIATPAAPSTIQLVKTCCGDRHDLGLDVDGVAYSLPSPLDFNPYPQITERHKVTDIVCGKEHCLLLTEHGQVYSWGGGSRGQLGHGSLLAEERPRLIQALDGMRIRKIAAGGWHSACISQFDDLYMFGWNESGQLAQTTNLVKPAECFATVEKLLMACCTMQPEDSSNPRGDAEDCEVYHKNDDESSMAEPMDPEKDGVSNCYPSAASCNDSNDATDLVVVQSVPMLVQIPTSAGKNHDAKVLDVGCGSRHTVVLTSGNQLWGFGWNKYGQLGLGHTLSRDSVEKISLPKGVTKNAKVKMLRCGDWGTVLVTTNKK